ncbi:MAG: UDP-N-acetylglucosamine 2-epimerase (non-hydrolyzing) [Candidatus Omnitrophica bacterium]|nr:UDP-N-acetylglucosamine 2-epimerase (non-hydrolyzing) [Candidatus Omnitrophota bacterium]
MKILTVFGTRPEAVKMAPVIKELRKHPQHFDCKVCVSAQHREMLDPFLRLFGIAADYDLNIMQEKQSLEYITSTILSQMGYLLEEERPDFVLVQGDTTTSMAAALAAFYKRVRIGHIEAGLRTGDKYQPFPEEINRRMIDTMSDLYFAHTQEAKDNLIAEGFPSDRIELTGNTVIDALLDVAQKEMDFAGTPLAAVPLAGKKVILVTAHRRENVGRPLEDICKALQAIAAKYADEAVIVYPVHLNPAVQETANALLKGHKNIFLIAPLDYVLFVHLMKSSYLILTDSGGIQEEAASLHKPVLVLREVTERPEALAAGATRLVGTDTKRIVDETSVLMEDPQAYQKMSHAANPYGDGQAGRRIAARLLKEF